MARDATGGVGGEQRSAKDHFGKRPVDYSYLCLPDTVDPRGPKTK